MSHQTKQPSITTSLKKPSGNGKIKIKLRRKKLKVDTEDILSPTKPKPSSISSLKRVLNLKKRNLPTSSTLESALESKKKTSRDKSNSSNKGFKSSKTIKSSQTSVLDSTITDPDLKPFWNDSSKELSKKLWLPTLTDGPDLDSISSSGSSIFMGHNFSQQTNQLSNQQKQNLDKISWPSSLTSLPSTTAQENIVCSRKIRIYPNQNQKIQFEKYFGTSRFFYNKGLEYLKTNGVKRGNLSFMKLRSKVITSDKDLKPEELWQNETPYDTRQLVLKELCASYKSGLTNLKNGNIKQFDLKYKSKRYSIQEVFHCNKKALKINLRLFSSRISQPLRARNKMKRWWEKNVNSIDHDFKIVKEKPDKYYIILTTTRKKVQKKGRKKVVALDPGVRTFQTFYDAEGSCGKIGDLESLRLMKRAKRLDLLLSLRTKIEEIGKRTRQNMKRRCYGLRTKIRNIVKDLHWKTCHFLCENYETILLPDFKVSGMVEKCPKRLRKINSKVVRSMLCLSHYMFKERLKYLVGCYSETRLIIVNESYTTKTCGNCGSVREMGGNKKYNCSSCGCSMDRDINGSRNILLRYMTKHGLDPTR